MAGSLNHIVDSDTGQFTMDGIENLGDAYEALEECFDIILAMSSGTMKEVNEYCEGLGYPTIGHDMVAERVED